ncbi:MAG: hypothetical protein MUF80_11780 [Burkholderiales bacterium]|nr:hypothetical protein [Burkholderiales bacterium]
MTKIETRHVHYIGLLLAFVIGGTASFGWTFLWPPRPVVTFAEGLPLVEPNTVRPGQDITVTYVIRRNETCTVTIYPRFLNRDTESIDGNVTRKHLCGRVGVCAAGRARAELPLFYCGRADASAVLCQRERGLRSGAGLGQWSVSRAGEPLVRPRDEPDCLLLVARGRRSR